MTRFLCFLFMITLSNLSVGMMQPDAIYDGDQDLGRAITPFYRAPQPGSLDAFFIFREGLELMHESFFALGVAKVNNDLRDEGLSKYPKIALQLMSYGERYFEPHDLFQVMLQQFDYSPLFTNPRILDEAERLKQFASNAYADGIQAGREAQNFSASNFDLLKKTIVQLSRNNFCFSKIRPLSPDEQILEHARLMAEHYAYSYGEWSAALKNFFRGDTEALRGEPVLGHMWTLNTKDNSRDPNHFIKHAAAAVAYGTFSVMGAIHEDVLRRLNRMQQADFTTDVSRQHIRYELERFKYSMFLNHRDPKSTCLEDLCGFYIAFYASRIRDQKPLPAFHQDVLRCVRDLMNELNTSGRRKFKKEETGLKDHKGHMFEWAFIDFMQGQIKQLHADMKEILDILDQYDRAKQGMVAAVTPIEEVKLLSLEEREKKEKQKQKQKEKKARQKARRAEEAAAMKPAAAPEPVPYSMAQPPAPVLKTELLATPTDPALLAEIEAANQAAAAHREERRQEKREAFAAAAASSSDEEPVVVAPVFKARDLPRKASKATFKSLMQMQPVNYDEVLKFLSTFKDIKMTDTATGVKIYGSLKDGSQRMLLFHRPHHEGNWLHRGSQACLKGLLMEMGYEPLSDEGPADLSAAAAPQ